MLNTLCKIPHFIKGKSENPKFWVNLKKIWTFGGPFCNFKENGVKNINFWGKYEEIFQIAGLEWDLEKFWDITKKKGV